MKKTYFNPTINVVEVKTEQLMTLSNGGIQFDGNGRGSINTQDDDAVSAGMSRGGSWDDED